MLLARIARHIKRKVRRAIAILRWATGSLVSSRNSNKSLLLIYDFASQPFSVGDILILQEASLIVRENLGLSSIDFAAVYDPLNPVVSDRAFNHIRPENFLYHLSSILPAAQVNPHLGSLMLFDSHKKLESFISDNAEHYSVWPSLADYASREYLFYGCFNQLFSDYHARHGKLPVLMSRPVVSEWARHFLKSHAGNSVAITVQLRKNPATPARNSDYESWISFFKIVAANYPAKFFVICAAPEIDERLRELQNVIVVKDFHSSLEQDLGLIENASMHMGPSSGPGTIAMFNRKPYCMFGFDTSPQLINGFITEGHRVRYSFSAPCQYWIRETENLDLIVQEFDYLWSALSRGFS